MRNTENEAINGKKIEDLRIQLEKCKEEQKQLEARMNAHRKKAFRSVRLHRKGNLFFVLGGVLAVVFLFLYMSKLIEKIEFFSSLQLWQVLAAVGLLLVGGVLFHIAGIISSKHTTKIYGSHKAAYNMMEGFRVELIELEKKKKNIERELDREVDQAYYQFVDSLKSGHIVRVVTCESWPDEDGVPREPKEGKKYYDIGNVVDITIYADGMSVGNAKKIESSGQKCYICHAKPGKAKNWCDCIQYRMNGYSRIYPEDNMQFPWVENMDSIIEWSHVSMNKRFCIVYSKRYNNVEDLREAVKLTKEEIMKYL